jgi:hypothetical protein
MAVPQGSLEAVWVGRTIVIALVGDELVTNVDGEVVRAWWDEGVYE